MNIKEIKEMINLMNENSLMELEIERDGSKIKLKKSFGGEAVHQVTNYSNPIPSAAQGAPETPQQTTSPAISGHEIISPMVGTFYRAPAPDAPPFVEIGKMVEVGQVVCIVEAMKLMNEIKSDVRGKIVSIPAENAHPVEYGETLFVVEEVK